MANLRDVAKMSGVSPATVSHVLNNRNHNMTAETRQRVLSAIRTLGYSPGTRASGDDTRRTRTIGVFFVLSGYPLSSNPYAVSLLDGILSTAMPQHWNVTLISVDAWEDARAQVRSSADGRCDGFIVVAPPPELEITDALHERGYPYVLVNGGSGNPNRDSVDVDNAAAINEITRHLIGLGHRHLAFLMGEQALENSQERLRGFQQAMTDAGLPAQNAWVLGPGSYDYGHTRARVGQFLERRQALPVENRPTALLCGNDLQASWASDVLQEQGLRIPEDISLVGFDDLPLAAAMNPPLTTVRQPLSAIGARATELLQARIAAREADPANFDASTSVSDFIPYHIVHRESVAAPQK